MTIPANGWPYLNVVMRKHHPTTEQLVLIRRELSELTDDSGQSYIKGVAALHGGGVRVSIDRERTEEFRKDLAKRIKKVVRAHCPKA